VCADRPVARGYAARVLHAIGFLGYEPAERMLWEHVEGPYHEAMNACEGEASTDCNGGLILGIALHGDRARAEFTRLLWNPWWEAHDGGTGSDRWAYAGARVLSLNMPELYIDLVAKLKSDTSTNDKRHCLKTFVALLDYWASRPWLGLNSAPEPTETCDALCDLLFESSTPPGGDSLIGLAGHVLDQDDHILTRLHELENELQVRARHELEIRTLVSR
jgi:hypothetical protein